MRRLHLFEFNDSAWVPAWFRDAETDYLHAVLRWLRPFDSMAPRLAALLRAAPRPCIVDLCSGGGGPLPTLRERLVRDHALECTVLLTDLAPNRPAFARLSAAHPALEPWPEPVDAREVPAALVGVRTLFDALHHFRPADARRILEDARRARVPLAAFEVAERRLPSLLGTLAIPLLVWVVTPWIRPFSWRRLLFTYAVPLLPLAIWWDGLVSNLRAHTPGELAALTRGLGGADYAFEVGREGGAAAVTYVIGAPLA
jgi:hypothetical protein